MFNKSIANTAIRYGVTGGGVSFLYILILAMLGFENPYNNVAEFSSTLLFMPVFVVLGIRDYRKYSDPSLGFSKAFGVGLSVGFFLALTTALLMLLFSLTLGADMIQPYIVEMQKQMEVNQAIPNHSIDQQKFELIYQELEQLNAYHLAQRTFNYRFITGLFVSLVSGVYFRK